MKTESHERRSLTPKALAVAREVCVVASGPLIRQPDLLYRRLATDLGRLIQQAADDASLDQLPAALVRDITGARGIAAARSWIKERVGRAALAPLDDQRRPPRQEPWVPCGGRLLCFYRLDDDTPGADGAEPVVALSRLVNLLAARGRRRLAADTYQVDGLTPTWLFAAAPHGTASPGSTPLAVEAVASALAALGTGDREEAGAGAASVLVAVLDTSPTEADVRAAIAARRGNALMERVLKTVSFNTDPPFAVPPDYLADYTANWRDPAAATADPALLRMADHGLFAAGLIRDRLPDETPVHLVRALNDQGAGDMLAIANIFQRVRDAFLGDHLDRRLVINLSLGAEVPTGVGLLRLWYPETWRALKGPLSGSKARSADSALAGVAANSSVGQDARLLALLAGDLIGAARASLTAALNALAADDPRVLVVAAAGNDNGLSDRGDPHEAAFATPFGALPLRPEPRWPAQDNSCLSVAALNRAGTPAAYSNRGDVISLINGVATFGGDADPDGQITDPDDAVLGIFSAETLPISGQANTSGWVRWSGTSFATPVISALAARVWSHDLNLSAGEVIDKVRVAGGGAVDGELDVPTIP